MIQNDPKSDFAKIANSMINDSRLSWDALGVAVYLYANPKIRINAKAIAGAGRCGRDKAKTLINELIKYGYLIKEDSKTERNKRRLPPDEWIVLRRKIFERDGFTCTYCGSHGVYLEADHIIPISRGGSNEESNLTTACRPCNRSKRDKLLEEWRS